MKEEILQEGVQESVNGMWAKQGKGVKTFSFQFHTYTGCDLTGKSYILIYQTSLIFSPNTCMPSTNASENPSSACKVV